MSPILDVRDAEAFECGHAPGSASIPLDELPGRMYELPEKGAAIRVFHDDADALGRAIALLSSRGYRAEAGDGQGLCETGIARARLWSPTPLLLEAMQYADRPGVVADLGCGSGREAVYLALHGWRVDAFDILPDALANAERLAARNGVVINALQSDLRTETDLGEARYDLVCMFRFWQERVFRIAVRSLRSGGVLAIEAFHPEDTRSKGETGKRVTAGRLPLLAADLRIHVARDVVRGGRKFAQLIAQHMG